MAHSCTALKRDAYKILAARLHCHCICSLLQSLIDCSASRTQLFSATLLMLL
ncbi:hypothetical protein Plhal304r1_c002g0008231 [Plasmopara halstedii]